MDEQVLAEWHKHYDEKFEKQYPQFAAWFKSHADYQQGISPRLAHRCERYRQEYLESKEYGLAENTA